MVHPEIHLMVEKNLNHAGCRTRTIFRNSKTFEKHQVQFWSGSNGIIEKKSLAFDRKIWSLQASRISHRYQKESWPCCCRTQLGCSESAPKSLYYRHWKTTLFSSAYFIAILVYSFAALRSLTFNMALRLLNLSFRVNNPMRTTQRFSHFTFVPDTVPASEGI